MIIVSQMPGIIIHATHMIVSIFLFSPFPFWPSLLGNSTTLNILVDNNVVEVRVFVKRLNWFGMVERNRRIIVEHNAEILCQRST